jgi:hypothetical protein
VLKRRRSRPSDWWAAPTTTPSQQDEPQTRKRGPHSTSPLAERKIQEAPTAVNRGKVAKSHAGPSAEDEKIAKKPGRRRSSNTEHELHDSAGNTPEHVPIPKRKRGRRSGAAVMEQVHITSSTEIESQVIPKKRRRPSGSKSEGPSEALVQDQSAPKKKRRRRSSILSTEEQRIVKAPEGGSIKAPRRGRPSNAQSELEAPTPSVSTDHGRSKRRTRPSNTEMQVRNRRTSQKGAEISEIDANESLEKDVEKSTARGRRSDTVLEVQTAASSFSANRTGRKNRKGTRAAANDDGSAGNSTAREKSRNERQKAGRDVLESSKPNASEDGTYDRRQKPTQEDDQETQTEKQPTYQHLAEVIHRISRQTIEEKWEPLPPNCIERVSNLVNDIQRPVVVRLSDEQKRTQASTALRMVSRRLIGKISKGLPFPRSTSNRREDDFDFEKILDHSRDLEAQLTLALHANDLLESELRKERAHLEAEEEALSQLETNAKREATRRKEAGRKLHVLLQSEDLTTKEDGLKDRTGLAVGHSDVPLTLVNLTPYRTWQIQS